MAMESERRFRLTDGIGLFESSWVVGHLELESQQDGSTELYLTFTLGRLALRWVHRLLATWVVLGASLGIVACEVASARDRLTATAVAVGVGYTVLTALFFARTLAIALATRDHEVKILRALGVADGWRRARRRTGNFRAHRLAVVVEEEPTFTARLSLNAFLTQFARPWVSAQRGFMLKASVCVGESGLMKTEHLPTTTLLAGFLSKRRPWGQNVPTSIGDVRVK